MTNATITDEEIEMGVLNSSMQPSELATDSAIGEQLQFNKGTAFKELEEYLKI